ncbi:MAG: hypothetical protein C4549_06005 [Deltaproteobacteria bacterium]|nr:MAG: hypothetical protein C4549_06005 [Deltaproteobacteria bacterium]
MPGDSKIPGHIQGIGSKGAIPWPHIAVGIPSKMLNVRIISSNDSSFGINVGSQDEQALFI